MKKLSMQASMVSRILEKHAPVPWQPVNRPAQRESPTSPKSKRDSSVQKLPRSWRRDPFPF